MLKPARANSWIVASWSEPFGMPSFSVIAEFHRSARRAKNGLSSALVVDQRSRETAARSGMADVAVAVPLHLEQHRIVVAVDEKGDDLERVARRLAFRPERLPRAAEEGGQAGAARRGERRLVHEADHQHFRALRVLDDRRDEPVQF